MQHNIYTLEKEMLREIERRSREASRTRETPARQTAPLGNWEVLVVTRTLVRIGPLVLAWDRH